MSRRLILLLLAASRAAAQAPDGGPPGSAARGGVVFESYSFGAGLAIERVHELTVPVTLTQRLGSRLTVDVSTAYASASVQTSDGRSLDLSGVLDTDLRAAYALVRGRLVLTLVGTLPTGKVEVADSVLPLFGALATDLLDFTTPSFGSGGAVTAGFAWATQLGASWSAGLGASYRYTAPYQSVASVGELEPGDEGRIRLGVEGPLGQGAYLRGAVVYALSGHDTLAGGPSGITGDRLLVYSSVNLPLGRGSLSLYGFEMRRFRPRAVNTTYRDAVQVPSGNVLALGARLDRPFSPTVSLAPSLEFRHELAGSSGLELLGYLVRAGADVRWSTSDRTTLVLQGRFAFGRLEDQGTSVSLRGPRLAAILEWMP